MLHETKKRRQRSKKERKFKFKRKRRSRRKLRNVDGDVPLCMRSYCEEYKDGSSKEEIEDGSSKKDSRSKTASGSKDLKKTAEAKPQAVAKIGAAAKQKRKTKKVQKKQMKNESLLSCNKNMRSMNSSERIEEMIQELEGYRWDAVLLNETWRPAKSEIWETHQKPIYMGAGKYENKHGEEILLNKK